METERECFEEASLQSRLRLGKHSCHCLLVRSAALSLKGTPSICVNPGAAGNTKGNKHYHCWEWLDIDTDSPTATKPVTEDWQRELAVCVCVCVGRRVGEWTSGL